MAADPTSIVQLEARLAELRASGTPSAELVDTLNDLAAKYMHDPPTSLRFSQEALELATGLNYQRGRAYSLLHQCDAKTTVATAHSHSNRRWRRYRSLSSSTTSF